MVIATAAAAIRERGTPQNQAIAQSSRSVDARCAVAAREATMYSHQVSLAAHACCYDIPGKLVPQTILQQK